MHQLRSYRPIMPVSVVAVFAISACTLTRDAGVPGAVHVDSAGVDIVLNAVAAAAVPIFATLDRVPELRLGSVYGRPEEQFGTIRGVVPFADGGVAVLDGQAAEIRLFDADGTYRMTLGSQGQGPGEFERPITLALLPGDTLAVYDAGPRRITRFGPDGAFVRTTTLKNTSARIVATAFLADGRLIGQSVYLDPDGATLPGSEPVFVRDIVVLTLFTAEGAVEDTIDMVRGREAVVGVERNGNGISVFKRTAAFGHTNVFTAHPDGFWSSANDQFELRLRDVETRRLIRIVRAPGLERPVTDKLVQAVHDQALGDATTANGRRLAEASFALAPRPETQPAYDLFAVDDRARLWVREWTSAELATRWWVFARDGELKGSVDVPSGMKILSVRCGADRTTSLMGRHSRGPQVAVVWGVERDELDVSYVVRYTLRGVEC